MRGLSVKFFLSIAASDARPIFFDYAFRLRLVTLPQSFKTTMNNTRSGAEIQNSEPSGRHAGTRGFWGLIVTQWQVAFSDNGLKQLALFIGISLGMGEAEQDRLSSLTMALLMLPFLFF